MNCLFCKIINQEIPSYTIYEDNLVKVFLDVNPDSPGHTLIIPKKHYQDLGDIDNQTLMHIMETSRVIKEKLENKLNCDGITLVQNNGESQEIKHYHLHLKPYYKNKENLSIEEVFKKITVE